MEVRGKNDLVVARSFANHAVPAVEHHGDDEHGAEQDELHGATQGIGGLGTGPGHTIGRGQLDHGVRGYEAPEAQTPQRNQRVARGDGQG